MPNACRKARFSGAISRLMSNVRCKRPDSSQLVVQTGFPTSLADIVVKNRSRLRKPRKHGTPPDSFGCKVSEIISAVHFRNDDFALPTALDLAGEAVEPTYDHDRTHLPVLSHGEEAATTSPLLRLRAAADAGTAFGIRPKITVAVMVLAACAVSAYKELVLGITVATIAILLLEFIATLVFATSPGDEKKGEEAAVEPGDDADGHHCVSESSDLLEVDADSDRRRYSRGHAKEDKGSNSESGRKESDPGEIDGIRMEEPSEKAGKSGDGRDDDADVDDDHSEVVNDDHQCSSSKEAIKMNKDRKMVCPKYLLLVVIVLSGLIGGRIVALGSTVAWWYLVKLTREGWFFKANR